MSENYDDDVNMNEEEQYEVEEILEKKKVGGKWKYKIKWVGYSVDQCTWEPMENLDNVLEMLAEFEADWTRKEEMKIEKKPSLKNSNLRDSKLEKKKEEIKKRRRPDEDDEDSSHPSPPQNNVNPSTLNSNHFKNSQSKLDQFAKKSDKFHKKSENEKKEKIEKSGALRYSKVDEIVLADDESPKIIGSVEIDKPKRLITAKLNSQTNEVNCLVEWEFRQSGIKPSDCYVSNKVLRERFPYLLLDFYESRLRFPALHEKKSD